MNMKINRKRVLILLVIVVFIGILSGLVYWQVKKPLRVLDANCRVLEFDGSFTFENFKSMYESCLKNNRIGYQYIRKNNIFPSDNGNDYCTVVIRLDIKNDSIFKLYGFNVYLECDDPDSPIIMASVSMEGFRGVERFEGIEDLCTIGLDIYRGNMTQEEILDYIKTLKMKLYFKNRITEDCEIKIDLGDYNVEFVN